MADSLRLRGIRHDGVVRSSRGDIDVSDMKDGSYNAKEVELLCGREADNIERVLSFEDFVS
jgi:hypothetical protein